jgi:hypothetical protein
VLDLIYNTPDGQAMLKDLERNLGLALVPVNRVA